MRVRVRFRVRVRARVLGLGWSGVRVRVRVRARVRVRVRVKRGAPSDRNTLRLDEPLHRGKVAARARHDKLKGLLVRV